MFWPQLGHPQVHKHDVVINKILLYLWFHASLIYINNCLRCNTKQSIYYSASSLYMFRVSNTPIISTQNCNYSLWYWSYFLCSYLPPTGGGGINAMPQLLYSWERNLALNTQEARWLSASLDRCRKSHPPPGFDPQTVWLLASYCTDYASLAHTTTTTNNNSKKKDDGYGGNNEKCGMRFSQQ